MKHELHPDQSNLSRHLYRVRLRTWVSRYVGERWHHVSVKRRKELDAGAIADSRKFSDHKRWQPDWGRAPLWDGSRQDIMYWREFRDRVQFPGSVGMSLKHSLADRNRRAIRFGRPEPEPMKLFTAESRWRKTTAFDASPA